jgi:multidrug efflux pump subunit AcrA (membrane-fusion protein)
MDSKKSNRPKKHVMIRIVICAVIIVFGWAGMNGLANLKRPPVEATTEEQAIRVRTVTVAPRDYPVTITGYGEARTLTVVTIAPEVSGRVVHTHPALKVGQIIPAGETLFLSIRPTTKPGFKRPAPAWPCGEVRLPASKSSSLSIPSVSKP